MFAEEELGEIESYGSPVQRKLVRNEAISGLLLLIQTFKRNDGMGYNHHQQRTDLIGSADPEEKTYKRNDDEAKTQIIMSTFQRLKTDVGGQTL